MSQDQFTDYELRLAVLEERTRPKRKTLADWFKDWAGVGTLTIALLYSFPLGVWDRFISDPVEKLRDTAVRLAQIDAEFSKTYNSIPAADARASWSRAISSQKAAIIRRSIDDISNHYTRLTAPEMILLGHNIAQFGRLELAEELYLAAARKADVEQIVWLQSDAFRMRAQLHRMGPTGIDLPKVRENYSRSIEVVAGSALSVYGLQASNNAFEWAVFELTAGDWACGWTLGNWAMQTVLKVPSNPLVQTYGEQYQLELSKYKQKANVEQPSTGCPADLTTWIGDSDEKATGSGN